MATARVLSDLASPLLLALQRDRQVCAYAVPGAWIEFTLPHTCAGCISWVYRNRSQTSELLVAQTKLAYACHDRSWFVSPRNSLSHERRSFTRSISGDFDTGRNSPDKRNGALLSTAAVSAEMLNPGQIEGVLSQLVEVAHAPRSGGILELRIHGEDFFTYHIQRGKAAHLDDYCFQLLFQCLSLKNVVYILNCMLLEQRVLVHSNVSVCLHIWFCGVYLPELVCLIVFTGVSP